MRKFIGLALLPLFSLSHAASAPVEDLESSAPMPRSSVAGPQSAAQSPQAQALTELHFEVQALRDEIRDLRGLMEEQAYELQQLKQRQLDDYQDLDRRISAALSEQSQSPVGGLPPASSGPRQSDDSASNVIGNNDAGAATSGSSPAVAGEGEYEAYTSAYNLLKAKKIDESIASFKVFVAKFPNSQYTANAYYWLGEVYMLQNNLEEAANAFAMVTEKFPAHRKAADAKFKLAKVYHLQGKTDQARTLLNEVADTNTSAAALAEAYLNDNF